MGAPGSLQERVSQALSRKRCRQYVQSDGTTSEARPGEDEVPEARPGEDEVLAAEEEEIEEPLAKVSRVDGVEEGNGEVDGAAAADTWPEDDAGTPTHTQCDPKDLNQVTKHKRDETNEPQQGERWIVLQKLPLDGTGHATMLWYSFHS